MVSDASPPLRQAASQGHDAADVAAWLGDLSRASRFEVERVPLSALTAWRLDDREGALVHRSGRFFRVEGRRIAGTFEQPVVVQPEVGILGMLAREVDGCLHFLVQAKAEPGNPGRFQLAPTVQATPSNFTRVHGGAPTRYLDWFTEAGRGRILFDRVQPEHASVFLAKKNRNVALVVDAPVQVGPLHRWMTVAQLEALLTFPNLVSMDTRTILACLPRCEPVPPPPDVVAWLAAIALPPSERVDLRRMQGWHLHERLERADGRAFSIAGVRVAADSREVPLWDQPIVAARARGQVAFLVQRQQGVVHVLGQAMAEHGAVEPAVGPTVQCSLGSCSAGTPPFLELVNEAPPAWVRYACNHSEEGGRFLDVETEHRLVEVPETEALAPPHRYRWLPLPTLEALVREGRVNLEARSLLACMRAAGVR